MKLGRKKKIKKKGYVSKTGSKKVGRNRNKGRKVG